MALYSPITDPSQFPHQHDTLADMWDKPGYAWWWEQGTGKSRAAIDNGGMLYCDGAIKGLFMLAPNGLHRNFITQQLKRHLPPEMHKDTRALFWHQSKANTKTWQEGAREFLKFGGLKVLAMSYDGITTDKGKALAKEFLTTTPSLYCADESARIANPEAWRTKVVLASAPYAPFRRVMTGTPVANAPWDIWAQIKFCDGSFWKQHGLDDYNAMKATFGQWDVAGRRVTMSPGAAMGRNKSLKAHYEREHMPPELQSFYKVEGGGTVFQIFPKLKEDAADGRPLYKNLNQLRGIIQPIRSRVLKKDVFPNLPKKIYTPLEFDMSPAQWRAYRSITDMGFAITDSGETCSASMALTLMLRQQQIACGYLVTDLDPSRCDPDDDDPRISPITPNPRLELLKEIVTDLDHQAIIWARFTPDVDAIIEMLKKLGKTSARYDGTISEDECAENEERFHEGKAQFFVSKAAKGGEGLTLIEAKTAIFYSYTFKLIEYLQASDRPDRYGQDTRVNEIFFKARGTVEEKICRSLQAKMDVASAVTGDTLRQWLTPEAQGDLFGMAA